MSNSRWAWGSLAPTGGSFPLALPVCQPYSSSRLAFAPASPGFTALSPKLYAVVVPARQQYSHSASVGRRISSSFPRSFAWRRTAVIFLHSFHASPNQILSTEFRGPFHLLGFSPTTASS